MRDKNLFVNSLAMPLVLFCVVFLFSNCGTEVHTGRNSTKLPSENSKKSGEEQRASENSCFGRSADAKKIVEPMCSALKDEDKKTFKRMYERLCVKGETQNLFLPDCGWSGGDSASRYLQVIESTDEDDKGTRDYDYFSVYSLSPQKSIGSLSEFLFFGYSKPEEFKKDYIFPDNTDVKPSSDGVQTVGDETQLDFEFSIRTSVLTIKFNNRMRSYSIGEDAEFVSEVLLEDSPHSNINYRRVAYFIFGKTPGQRRIVSFSECGVPDRGLHSHANRTLYAQDLGRMKLFLQNIQIDSKRH